MKHQILLIVCFLCLSLTGYAQDKLFDKFSDMDQVSSVYISKSMFQMMPELSAAGLNLIHLKGKIDNLQVLSTEDAAVREEMKKDFHAAIGKTYESWMKVKSDGTKADFMVKKNGDKLHEMIMLADTDSSYVIIRMTGNFTMDDMQELAGQSQNDNKK